MASYYSMESVVCIHHVYVYKTIWHPSVDEELALIQLRTFLEFGLNQECINEKKHTVGACNSQF